MFSDACFLKVFCKMYLFICWLSLTKHKRLNDSQSCLQPTETDPERCRRESRPDPSPDRTPDRDPFNPVAATTPNDPEASTPTSSPADTLKDSVRRRSRWISPATFRTRRTWGTRTSTRVGPAVRPEWSIGATGSGSTLPNKSGKTDLESEIYFFHNLKIEIAFQFL